MAVTPFCMDVAGLYERHRASLRRYLERVTGDPEQAADAVQETYLRLIGGPGPAPGNDVRAWLFRVATNIVRDDWRRRRRAVLELDVPDRVSPLEDLERAERRALVKSLLAQLPTRQRMALVMREEGITYKAIAEVLDVSPNSIGPLAARGLARLESLLRGAGEQGS